MADLAGPLRSLRDSLHALLIRIGDDPGRSNRVTGSILKVNQLLIDGATGDDGVSNHLRQLTERIAALKPGTGGKFDAVMGELETVLTSLG
jgi:hypothetical protein